MKNKDRASLRSQFKLSLKEIFVDFISNYMDTMIVELVEIYRSNLYQNKWDLKRYEQHIIISFFL